MSFTSFSTSIIYNEKTATPKKQQASQTVIPSQEVHSEGLRDSYLQDYARFPHSIHEFAKRKLNPENKTSLITKPSNGSRTAVQSALNETAKASAYEWSYDKASVAASSIFGAIAAAAVVFLVVLCIKKFRRRQKRKREGDWDPLEEKRRKREAMMFSKNTSDEYLVEQRNGAVTRVLCTGRTMLSKLTSNNSGGPVTKTNSVPPDMRAKIARHLEDLNQTHSGRSGSLPKQTVIVTSPLQSVSSHTAVPGTEPTSPVLPLALDKPAEKTEATISETLEPQLSGRSETEITRRDSYRLSLFRLPSIKQTMSPLFQF
ncbi:hypothetical protein BJX61DRAFT_1245 [Aspergillus egyptiacus]|nr:hypothetical protein BJX61DRAFT_1245 [Aspergillus egyptiacus]